MKLKINVQVHLFENLIFLLKKFLVFLTCHRLEFLFSSSCSYNFLYLIEQSHVDNRKSWDFFLGVMLTLWNSRMAFMEKRARIFHRCIWVGYHCEKDGISVWKPKRKLRSDPRERQDHFLLRTPDWTMD